MRIDRYSRPKYTTARSSCLAVFSREVFFTKAPCGLCCRYLKIRSWPVQENQSKVDAYFRSRKEYLGTWKGKWELEGGGECHDYLNHNAMSERWLSCINAENCQVVKSQISISLMIKEEKVWQSVHESILICIKKGKIEAS